MTTMASVYEESTGRVPVQHAGRALDVVMPVARPALYRLFLLAKRLVDIGIGLVGCLLLLVVIPFVWLANRLACPGSLFFIQERVGKGGKSSAWSSSGQWSWMPRKTPEPSGPRKETAALPRSEPSCARPASTRRPVLERPQR